MPPNDVVVTLASGATDLAGNPLVLPAGNWSWRVPPYLPFAPSLSALDGAAEAQSPSLVFVPGSKDAFVAWNEVKAGASEAFFRHWDGEQWADMGGIPQPIEPENRYSPKLVLSNSGKLFAGVVAMSPGNKVGRVAEWTGLAWKEVGPGSYCNVLGLGKFTIAVDPQSRPHVAFSEFYPTGDPNEGEVYVCRFNGERWEDVGTPRSLPGIDTRAELGDLAFGPDGSPVVAWTQESENRDRTYVERWDGTRWSRVSTQIDSLQTNATVRLVQLAIGRDGTVYVAWVESDFVNPGALYLVRGNGVWTKMGDVIRPMHSEGRKAITWISLALDGNDFPVITWSEGGSGGSAVFTQRWTGTTWTERLAVSATPSRMSGRSPALAFDTEGAPVVAYSESDGMRASVHLQRFNQ